MAEVTESALFRIDLVNLCLWRRSAAGGGDERLDLPPKTFDVLHYLVENTGRLVTHDELLAALWGDVHVQPEVLKSHILAIRNALGDKSSSPWFIETQRGRGYRFIGEMKGIAASAPAPQAPVELGVFAGRAEPLRELLALFQRAASGEPQTVFITGEPGIGKTTLVQHFLRLALGRHDLVAAQGHCFEGFAGVEPYYPMLEALGDLCKGAGKTRVVRTVLELAPSWAAQMPAQISLGQRASLRQQIVPDPQSRMVREACNLFDALATDQPLVLVLEDLHWADFATIDFLSALCRRRSSAKLLLIATYRPEDVTTARHPLKQMTYDLVLRKYCNEIELAPLSTAAIGEVLTGSTESEPASLEFTRLVEERTGGNPLFMRVTLDYHFERGEISRTAQGWQPLVPLNELASEVPPTLARAIEARIERMSDEQRRVLEAASVAGTRFDPLTAARAAQMDELSFEAICESLTVGTLHRDRLLTLPNNQIVRAYAFNHALYRQVLYDRIGQVRRSSLHRTIGERLEEIYPPDRRGDQAVLLAQHFASAGDWARALDYLRSALRVATDRFSCPDALAILDYAAEQAVHLPDGARIRAEIELLDRRAAIQAVGNDPKARETYAQLADKAGRHGDVNTQCRALIGLAYVSSWHDLSLSLPVLNEVLKLCDKQSDPIQRDIVRMSAYVHRIWESGWNRADAGKCEAALARLKDYGDRLTTAWAQINFSMLCLVSSRYRESHDLVDCSYRLLHESPQNVVEAELVRAAWMRHIGMPWCLFSFGEFGAGLADMNASITAFESGGDASAAHLLQVFRGALLYHAMDFEGVLRHCAPAVALPLEHYRAPTIGDLPLKYRVAQIYCGLAEAGLGNNAAALDHLRAAEGEMARQSVHLDWYWRLALEWGMVNVLIAVGDHPTALLRAERLCDLAAETDDRTWQALAWEAHARAALSGGDVTKAIDAVGNALAACEKAEVPLAEWRVHATSASAFGALGDNRRAGTHARLGAAARKRLAESLPEGDPIRLIFERRSGSLCEA
jgi:DNA-binding winged helix-turn-helix (wHTH) protein/tetratricopeptide (TPR) repeat protein